MTQPEESVGNTDVLISKSDGMTESICSFLLYCVSQFNCLTGLRIQLKLNLKYI